MQRDERTEPRLGALVDVYPVSGRIRPILGGALMTVAGGVLFLFLVDAPELESGRLLGISLILPAVGVPLLLTALTRAVRGGRGEFFALYERGLLHGARAGRRCWTWEEIAELNLTPPPDPTGDVPGRQHKCSMRFTDGPRALIDRYTTEAPVLIDGIRAGTASTQPPSSTRQVMPWLWAAPILLGAFGTTAVQLIQHLVASQEAESTYVWYATAVIVCLVGAVFSLLATVALVVLCAKAWPSPPGGSSTTRTSRLPGYPGPANRDEKNAGDHDQRDQHGSP